MRKGQLVGQIFIYILSVVIIAAILIYGYTAVSEFRERSSTVAEVKLQSDITNAIARLSSDYGSVQRKELYMGEHLKICFVDTYESVNPDNFPSTVNPLIKDNVRSKTGDNVFLLRTTLEKSFNAGTIGVDYPAPGAQDTNIFCLNATANRVTVRLEGKGDQVLVSPWQ
jgi:hypothetical protein